MSSSKKIILVGNGTDAVSREAGEQIDSFDVVVRFNNFKIEGYEKNVGTKTDIWATRMCDTIDHTGKDENDFKIISVMNYCKWTRYMYPLIPKWYDRYPNMEIIRPETVKQYSREFDYDPLKNWLTVGYIMIKYFLEQYDKVYLYGFGGDVNSHYHNVKPAGQDHHNFKLEAEKIKELEEKGKVIRI